MEERQLTVDGQTYALPEPFLVLATQNPVQFEGTFPLPEAQLDRFFFTITLGYPVLEDEMAMLDHQQHAHPLDFLAVVAGVAALAHRLIRLGWPEPGSTPASAIVTEILDRVPVPGAAAPSGRGALAWDSGRR